MLFSGGWELENTISEDDDPLNRKWKAGMLFLEVGKISFKMYDRKVTDAFDEHYDTWYLRYSVVTRTRVPGYPAFIVSNEKIPSGWQFSRGTFWYNPTPPTLVQLD